MVRYLLARLVAAIAVVFVVASLVFIITHVLTDPARATLPYDAPQEVYEARRVQLGLDAPLADQYLDFVGSLATGDLGESYWQNRPATDIIRERLPETLKLVGGAMLITLLAAVPLGILAAWAERRFPDLAVLGFSMFAISAPPFWIGYLLIIVFAVNLGWVPTFGTDGWTSVILPSLAIALAGIGRLSQMLRRAIVDQLHEPYSVTATARGFSRRYTIAHHTLRNVAADFATFTGWELTRMFTGATIAVEFVFSWPGLGRLAIQATEEQDLVLLQATVVVIAAVVVLINLCIDITRRLLDPRVELA